MYGKDTPETNRPTYQMPKNKSRQPDMAQQNKMKENIKIIDEPALTGDVSLYTAQNARFTVECTECGKQRVMYGKSKQTERYNSQLGLLLSEYQYTCGAPLSPLIMSFMGN